MRAKDLQLVVVMILQCGKKDTMLTTARKSRRKAPLLKIKRLLSQLFPKLSDRTSIVR